MLNDDDWFYHFTSCLRSNSFLYLSPNEPPPMSAPPQLIEGLPAEKLFSFGWSPDGKRFAYSRGAQIHELVLIQNSR